MSQHSIDDPRSAVGTADVYAEGEISPVEAEKVMTNLTNGSVGVLYDGPGELRDQQLVETQEAAEVLNTALKYGAEMTPDERLERQEAMEELGFDNSAYGSGSVVQELVDGHGEQGSETPVYLQVGTDGQMRGSEYAVVVEDLQTAVRSTEEDFNAQLILEGNIAGEPNSQEDIQDFARTVGGELGEAYQTVADL